MQAVRKGIQKIKHAVHPPTDTLRYQAISLLILRKALSSKEWYEETHLHPYRFVQNFTLYFYFIFTFSQCAPFDAVFAHCCYHLSFRVCIFEFKQHYGMKRKFYLFWHDDSFSYFFSFFTWNSSKINDEISPLFLCFLDPIGVELIVKHGCA